MISLAQIDLDSFVQLLSWVVFASVLLANLLYDAFCFVVVKVLRRMLKTERENQCEIK